MRRIAPTALKSIFLVLIILSFLQINPQMTCALASGDYEYTVTGGCAIITKYTGSGGNITIPGVIDGYYVTGIGNVAFYGCSGLTGVTIPYGVNTIGSYAFGSCPNLTSVTVPFSVVSIDNGAFSNCTSLTGISFSSLYTNIGECAFYNCTSLWSVTFPSIITFRPTIKVSETSGAVIGNRAFYKCNSLTSISIPNTYVKVGSEAFRDCTSLANVDMYYTGTSISDGMFYGCTNLTSIIMSYSTPSIGASAFSGCSKLTNMTIPNSVTSIGDFAFNGCQSLTSMIIPDGVTSIGIAPFLYCSKLIRIDVGSANTAFASTDGILSNKSKTTLVCYPAGKTNSSFTIPNSITSIGDMAFHGCINLTKVDIPSSVTSISEGAFRYCIGLTSVTIPNSITSIDKHAFLECYGLKSVTIGSNVANIGDNVFQYCSKLIEAKFYGNAPSMGQDVFGECDPGFKIYYLAGRTGYTNPWYGYPTQPFKDSYIAVCNFVTRLYQLCLGRMPDESGLKYWADGLVNKTFTGAAVANNFIFSKEFLSRNVTDSQYIDIMYKAFFNRTADSSGKAYWLARLANGNSRLYVLACFVNSAEFNTVCSTYGINRGSITLTKSQDLYPKITEFVYRLYVKCLGRKPDDSGLNYYVSQLASGKMSGTSAAYSFVFSTELTSRNLSNKDFVTILYRVFFNREPDAGGLAYYVGKLSSGSSRASVFYSFASSSEFASICSSCGIKVK